MAGYDGYGPVAPVPRRDQACQNAGMDEPPAEGRSDPQLTFADVLRSESARWLLLAEWCRPESQAAIDSLARLGIDPTPLRLVSSALRQRALLLHSAHEAQARAYDDMLAAGGPHNPLAMRAYKAATAFNMALLPDPPPYRS